MLLSLHINPSTNSFISATSVSATVGAHWITRPRKHASPTMHLNVRPPGSTTSTTVWMLVGLVTLHALIIAPASQRSGHPRQEQSQHWVRHWALQRQYIRVVSLSRTQEGCTCAADIDKKPVWHQCFYNGPVGSFQRIYVVWIFVRDWNMLVMVVQSFQFTKLRNFDRNCNDLCWRAQHIRPQLHGISKSFNVMCMYSTMPLNASKEKKGYIRHCLFPISCSLNSW